MRIRANEPPTPSRPTLLHGDAHASTALLDAHVALIHKIRLESARATLVGQLTECRENERATRRARQDALNDVQRAQNALEQAQRTLERAELAAHGFKGPFESAVAETEKVMRELGVLDDEIKQCHDEFGRQDVDVQCDQAGDSTVAVSVHYEEQAQQPPCVLDHPPATTTAPMTDSSRTDVPAPMCEAATVTVLKSADAAVCHNEIASLSTPETATATATEANTSVPEITLPAVFDFKATSAGAHTTAAPAASPRIASTPALETSATSSMPTTDKEEDIHRIAQVDKIRLLLSLLSPDNFVALKSEFLFSARYFSVLTAVCELLVQTAADNPKNASTYAQLAKFFYTNLPLPPGVRDSPEQRREYSATVRRFIVVANQNKFQGRADWAERLATGSSQQQEEARKIRSQVLGHVQFVGQLYVHGILNGKVFTLHLSSMISKPINQATYPKEEDIECALTLLTTAGSHADRILGLSLCDPWYDMLADLYHKSTLSPCVKAGIARLLDLRAACWIQARIVQPGQGVICRGRRSARFLSWTAADLAGRPQRKGTAGEPVGHDFPFY